MLLINNRPVTLLAPGVIEINLASGFLRVSSFGVKEPMGFRHMGARQLSA
jgi:hypothetical protein